MKGSIIFNFIYDKMLYAYCYFNIWLDQKVEQANDFRKNILWIKENGPYNGPDQ